MPAPDWTRRRQAHHHGGRIDITPGTPPPLLHPACHHRGALHDCQYLQQLQVIALGDGSIRTAKWYALANLAFSIQDEGRIVITSTATATSPIVIDATGWAGFGDGPTSAFFVDNSRVLFNNIQFQGFINPAVYGIDSDVEFVNCFFQNNVQAGGFEQGSGIIMTGGSVSLPSYGNGFVLSQSELTVSGVTLAVPVGVTPGSFFTAERGSCINLSLHARRRRRMLLRPPWLPMPSLTPTSWRTEASRPRGGGPHGKLGIVPFCDYYPFLGA